tara:strand:- start:182 stop:439 length:258 start_codon:yes stop_codon:yes gene_type:complete
MLNLINLKNELRKMDSLSELNDLSVFINECKTMLGKSTLCVGSKVNVVQKTKKTPGVITKMKVKKAIVDMNGMSYNVPLAMLELA